MREIITLQFGHAANHVGTHFWNSLQYDQDCNNSVLFTETPSSSTPRLIILDKKGAFGSLAKREKESLPDSDIGFKVANV
jgi:hypothetical protein